ncbi:MAG: AAA family ATPase [Silicimonas sp.]|uniref:nucleotide-binding protein n=1 Tax=Marinovum algicola TaxID=42444 RepID=UPI0032EDF71C
MLVVTAISAKGGSGKTTLIQMLASAMLARGGRVHVMDADADQQILEWQAKSTGADFGDLPRLPWPERLTVADAPPTVEALYARLDALDAEGIDLTLIDTRPGEHPDTETLALAADMILVPAVPVQSDFVAALKTLTWIGRMIATLGPEDPAPLYRAVLMNADKRAIDFVTAASDLDRDRARQKLHRQDAEVFDVISTLPLLPTPVAATISLQRMPLTGPLSHVRDIYAQDLRHRLQAGHLTAALEVCHEVLKDIEDLSGAARG